MRRWRAFRAVCGHFRSGLLGTGRKELYPLPTWRELLETAKAHFALPALSWCLRDEAAVPPEARHYLDAILRLNGKRNDQLCEQLARVVHALNAIDIEPTLLKGAAHLARGLYPAPAIRLMGDLDMLIPEKRAADAVAALRRLGFAPLDVDLEGHHHLPPMHLAETSVAIEMHTRLMHKEDHLLVPIAWVDEHTQPIAFHGLRVRTPDPTILIAHNVVHDQLNHRNFERNRVELRQLLDFALIRARYANEIDWPELDRRFKSAGHDEVLATYLHYDRTLFGQPTPAVAGAPRSRAIGRMRRAIEEPARQARRRRLQQWVARIGMIVTLPKYYVRARRQDPRGVVRIFSPHAWVQRSRAIRRDWRDQ